MTFVFTHTYIPHSIHNKFDNYQGTKVLTQKEKKKIKF